MVSWVLSFSQQLKCLVMILKEPVRDGGKDFKWMLQSKRVGCAPAIYLEVEAFFKNGKLKNSSKPSVELWHGLRINQVYVCTLVGYSSPQSNPPSSYVHKAYAFTSQKLLSPKSTFQDLKILSCFFYNLLFVLPFLGVCTHN